MENKEIVVEAEEVTTAEIDKIKNKKEVSKMRQIIIETDGNDIKLVKSETAGTIELIAIFQTLIGYLSSKK